MLGVMLEDGGGGAGGDVVKEQKKARALDVVRRSENRGAEGVETSSEAAGRTPRGEGLRMLDLCGGMATAAVAAVTAGRHLEKYWLVEIDDKARKAAARHIDLASKRYPLGVGPEVARTREAT